MRLVGQFGGGRQKALGALQQLGLQVFAGVPLTVAGIGHASDLGKGAGTQQAVREEFVRL